VESADWSCDEIKESAALRTYNLEFRISPNPFNPTTAISFELRDASIVNLAVYDISGRLVATLADGGRETGKHEEVFDASVLPSGIYFARLAAAGQQQVLKIVLMK
jgi:hypothetical protein